MDRQGGRSCRRGLTGVGVLGLHALLIALFLGAGKQRARTTRLTSEPSNVLLLIELRARQPEPAQVKPTGASLRSPKPPKSQRINPPSDTSISVPTATRTPYPRIDWHHEAELAGSRQALLGPSKLAGGSDRSVSTSVTCKVRPQQHWEPEPKRAGFAGGLPYVRLGRCIVGLGFFGCALSSPAPANGHVLDAARDADYDVLDGPDCVP